MAPRAKRAKPKAEKRGAAGAAPAPAADGVARIEAAIAGLRAEVAAALAEVPKAEDFQPLADHLYAFAESAPRLIRSLEAVTSSVGPMQAAARSLGEVAEVLLATQESWNESLLRLPRAEDYEPLAAPLREFARVSPALAETLAEALRTLRATAAAPPAGGAGALAGALTEAADRLAAARATIRRALDGLPRDPAYATFAAHLKELATVSPSLMEWLRQVPALSLPLGEAVADLEEAARELEAAERAARRALAGR